MSWIVKNIRPEEIYQDPNFYFNEENAKRYANSSSMKRIQQKIANIILTNFIKKKGKILDIGCGPGFSMEIFLQNGFKTKGLDISEEMVNIAKKRGYNVKLGSITNRKDIYVKEKFDYIISISAFQWIKEYDKMKKAAENMYFMLKDKGIAIIQFYPFSEQELNKLKKAMKSAGFIVKEHIINPNSSRKRLIFVLGLKN